ncbi:MAG: AAA+ ATPase superfamily predicted ATPase, partial [Saprospiraceae bacterium]
MTQVIGRERELQVLQKALDSNKAEMVSVIGRRRVGKTFLVDTFYADRIVYSVTGTQDAPLGEQLENFAYNIQRFSKSKIPVR